MIRLRSSGNEVHAVGDPLEDVARRQSLERSPGNPGCLGLLPREQTPLILSYLTKTRLGDSGHVNLRFSPITNDS